MTEDRSISIDEAREIAISAAREAEELRNKQVEEDAAFYDSLYECTDYFDELIELQREVNEILWVLQEYVELAEFSDIR